MKTDIIKTDEERLELYREVLGIAWDFKDYFDWPIKLNSSFHLFLKEWGEEVIEDVLALEEEKKQDWYEIGHLFPNPARIFRLIDYTIYSMRKNRYSLQKQRQIVLKLLSMVKTLKYGSEFNEDGRNIIFDDKKVEQVDSEFIGSGKCSIEDSKIIHRFCGLAWAYSEAVLFRVHDVTKELHGPYRYQDNTRQLVVKEFLELDPKVIWPGIELSPYNSVKIYKNYNDNVKLSIDALNHIYHSGGKLVTDLTGYYIEFDGKKGTVEELKELMEIMGKAIAEISIMVEDMSWNERVVKYAQMFWFRKKPLRDGRGLNWQPPKSVLENIMAGKENVSRMRQLSPEQVRRLAKITI
ncbi:MAG: hypothetical protein GY757_39220 [bacterium]|nr:hypothetical protein [bacterium]